MTCKKLYIWNKLKHQIQVHGNLLYTKVAFQITEENYVLTKSLKIQCSHLDTMTAESKYNCLYPYIKQIGAKI